jgi:hypothetical protein
VGRVAVPGFYRHVHDRLYGAPGGQVRGRWCLTTTTSTSKSSSTRLLRAVAWLPPCGLWLAGEEVHASAVAGPVAPVRPLVAALVTLGADHLGRFGIDQCLQDEHDASRTTSIFPPARSASTRWVTSDFVTVTGSLPSAELGRSAEDLGVHLSGGPRLLHHSQGRQPERCWHQPLDEIAVHLRQLVEALHNALLELLGAPLKPRPQEVTEKAHRS